MLIKKLKQATKAGSRSMWDCHRFVTACYLETMLPMISHPIEEANKIRRNHIHFTHAAILWLDFPWGGIPFEFDTSMTIDRYIDSAIISHR